MGGRQTRKNCSFCGHPERDSLEQNINSGVYSSEELDREQGWAEGTTHRHMRRHSSEYHNNSNSNCPLCTHPERSLIEESILNQTAGIDDFAEELDIPSSLISTHMNNHRTALIQKEVKVEVMPKAIRSAHDSLNRIESNMNRLDRLFVLVLDKLENDIADEDEIFELKELDTAIKLHKEVRETLKDLAVWMEKTENVDKQQSVSIIEVLQQVFSEKAPEEWREMRSALAQAGVLE